MYEQTTGDIHWRRDVGAPVFADAQLLTLVDNKQLLLLIASVDGAVHLLDAVDGDALHVVRCDAQQFFCAPALLADDIVLAYSQTGRVLLLHVTGASKIVTTSHVDVPNACFVRTPLLMRETSTNRLVCIASHTRGMVTVYTVTLPLTTVGGRTIEFQHNSTFALAGDCFSSVRYSSTTGHLLVGCRDDCLYVLKMHNHN
jgi:hypothetical protein